MCPVFCTAPPNSLDMSGRLPMVWLQGNGTSLLVRAPRAVVESSPLPGPWPRAPLAHLPQPVLCLLWLADSHSHFSELGAFSALLFYLLGGSLFSWPWVFPFRREEEGGGGESLEQARQLGKRKKEGNKSHHPLCLGVTWRLPALSPRASCHGAQLPRAP